MIKTLAIETSCDDTSIGIISFNGSTFNVEKILAYSQINDHQQYGGVVPEIASRLHEEKIITLLRQFSKEEIENIDFISVTSTPGLPGSLIVGLTCANTLSAIFNKKVINVNHIHGHIFSIFLERNISEIQFPLAILTASGGHNEIYIVDNSQGLNFDLNLIGKSIDDASGECFDKVSRMLGGPYPGGVRVSSNAAKSSGNLNYQFKRIFLKSDEYNFSFSGMKAQVHYLIEKLNKEGIELKNQIINDICFEFQESVVEVLGKKLLKAAHNYNCKTVGLCGGVSSNLRLYEYTKQLVQTKYKSGFKVIKPVKNLYSTDNSAMIGVAGIIQYLNEK